MVRLEQDDKEFKKLFNHSIFKGSIYEKLKDADSPEGELLRSYEKFFLEFLSDIKGQIRNLYTLFDVQSHVLSGKLSKHELSTIYKLELQIKENLSQIGETIDAKYQKLFTEIALREGKSSFAVQFVANRRKFSDSKPSLWFIVEIVAVIQIYLYGVYYYTIEEKVDIDVLENDIPGIKQAVAIAIIEGKENYERILRGENPEYPHKLQNFCKRYAWDTGINIIFIGSYKGGIQSFLMDCVVYYVRNSIDHLFKYAETKEVEKKVAVKITKIHLILARAITLGVEEASKQHNNYDAEKSIINRAKKLLTQTVDTYHERYARL